MSSSIGSCNVSLSVTTITNIESNTEGILGPDYVQAILLAVSAAEASRPSGMKSTYLSKLWIILETLEEGAVESNMQSMRNKYENVLSRHFTTNDWMF